MLSETSSRTPAIEPDLTGKNAISLRAAGERAAKFAAWLQNACAALETRQATLGQLRPSIRALHRIERHLRRPLRIAILGEFNSGKSSLANLLVGIDSLPTAVVSNTRIPTLLYHAAAPEIFAVAAGGGRHRLDAERSSHGNDALRLEVGLPSEQLRHLQVLDLPGLSDPRFDETATDLAAHSIDAVLWCTVATQAWKESERLAWTRVAPRLRSRGLLAVTHRDLLRDTADQIKLMTRLHHQAGPEFQDIVMVSSVADAPFTHEGPQPLSRAGILGESIAGLLNGVLCERIAAAVKVTGRIARHAEAIIEPAPALVAAE
jgi:hypothetical protein